MTNRTERDGTQVVTVPLGELMRMEVPATAIGVAEHVRLSEMMAAWREAGFSGQFGEYTVETWSDREMVLRFPAR